MTKGGIVSLTRDLAAEWGKYSIRVNALAPGWIRTPMTTALQNDAARARRVLERVPLGRWGEPEDVAGAPLFLASDASRYITGHTIPVDGATLSIGFGINRSFDGRCGIDLSLLPRFGSLLLTTRFSLRWINRVFKRR